MVDQRLRKISFASLVAATVAIFVAGCNSGDSSSTEKTEGGTNATTTTAEKLSGSISIDGSSTVFPISEAFSEEFGKDQSAVKFAVASSGTGGGFKKFAAGELDITGASRPIEASEIEAAKKNNIEFVELPIAFDGLSVIVNPKNSFAETLTVAELKKIWEPNSKVKTWKDVRSDFPAEPIKLYGAGTDSGTFDYFTKAIVGKEKSSRTDYQASEDDNVLVQGVSGDEFSLGYFGYAYYEQNQDKLKLVKVDAGKGGIAPSPETIADGTYAPLSRPLFLYINKKSLDDKPEVKAFVAFLLAKAKEIVPTTGYVQLPDEAYTIAQERVDKKVVGTSFQGAETGITITDLLKRETVK